MQRIYTDQNIDDVLDLRSNSEQLPRTMINGVEHFTYSISDQSAQFTLAVHIDQDPDHVVKVRDTHSNAIQQDSSFYERYIQKLFDSIDPYIDIDFAQNSFEKVSSRSTNSDINVALLESSTIADAGIGFLDRNTNQGWALWKEQNKSRDIPEYGDAATRTLIGHEIGHVLGLSHYKEHRPAELDGHIVSLMDYDSAGKHVGFTALDKAALQEMYGVENDYRVISENEGELGMYADESGNIFLNTDIEYDSRGRAEVMYRGAEDTMKFEYIRDFNSNRMSANRTIRNTRGSTEELKFVTALTTNDPILGEQNHVFYRGSSSLEVWGMDSDWYANSYRRPGIRSGRVLSLENEFGLDLNADGLTGARLIEANGFDGLYQANNGFYYAKLNTFDGSTDYHSIGDTRGRQVREGRSWELIGVDYMNSRRGLGTDGNVAVWKHKRSGRLSAWNLNDDYNKVGKGYTLRGLRLGWTESSFRQDLDDNGKIGNLDFGSIFTDAFGRF